MKQYNIVFRNDMGHLVIDNFENIPINIREFAYKAIENKINYATDNSNLGVRYFILRSGLNTTWTYIINNEKIIFDYSKLNKYDSKNMRYI